MKQSEANHSMRQTAAACAAVGEFDRPVKGYEKNKISRSNQTGYPPNDRIVERIHRYP
jgi:hypothetical protein